MRPDMQVSSPRGWPYTVGSSPEPLPSSAWVQSLRLMHPLSTDVLPSGDNISAADLLSWVGKHSITLEEGEGGTLEEWLIENDMTPISERRLVLVVGELANPYRITDLGISGIPIIPVRIDGVARTWTDTMDSREVQPGVHHITLARTKGWWERTLLALPDIDQLRKMTTWLNDGSATNWRWFKLAEGSIHIAPDQELRAPTQEMLQYDGEIEWVEGKAPEPNGPSLDLNDVTVILHTRQGIYDHRGRIARCVHYPQRLFHNDVYRRGSAKLWNDVISTL